MRTSLLALMLAAAWGTAALAQDDRSGPTIVVTEDRIQDYRDRLAECLARQCPTDEDADASLALAEALFLEGDYGESRSVLRSSLNRNDDNAGEYPEPVSDLFRAHARLSQHMGYTQDTRRSTYGILDALQEGLPEEDYRHFTARFEIAEYQIKAGDIKSARQELERLIDVARAAGRDDVVALAELRGLWFDYVGAVNGEPGNNPRDVKLRLLRIADQGEPEQRMRAIGAQLLLARIFRAEGDNDRADALLAAIGTGSARAGEPRRVLFSPAYELQVQEIPALQSATSYRELVDFSSGRGQQSDNFENTWIDVGFWVLPDGTVSNLEIVRRGADPGWADPLLDSIRGRRYTEAPEATYRLERYSYTADLETTLRSRIAQRSSRARVEYLDLTVAEAPRPDGPAGT